MRSHTTLSISALAAALALGAAAQTRDPAPTPPNRSIVTAEAPRAAGAENKNTEDLEFLTEALRTGLAEVQMGELAAQRGHDPRVRAYGAKLKTDHAAQAAEIEKLLQAAQRRDPGRTVLRGTGASCRARASLGRSVRLQVRRDDDRVAHGSHREVRRADAREPGPHAARLRGEGLADVARAFGASEALR